MGKRVALVMAAFAIVMAGPNLPTPLYPYYRASLGLSPFGLTLLVGAYLVALVAVLLSAGWFARRSPPRALLTAGLVVMSVSDALLACPPTTMGLVTGRALEGFAVGASTGAVAVLLGHHGSVRTGSVPAVCALLGSAAGTALTAVLAEYLPWPHTLVYLVHAAASLASGALLWLVPALGRPRRGDAGRSAGGAVVRTGGLARFRVACASGIAAWVTAGLVVALVPSYSVLLLQASDLIEVAIPVVVFLVAAGGGSVAAGRWRPRAEIPIAALLMSAGLVMVAISGPCRSTSFLIVGTLVTGVGQGLGFRSGFAAVLALSSPERHGIAASWYNAAAYLGAAVTTLGMGLMAGGVGLGNAFWMAAVLFTAGALALAAMALKLFSGSESEALPEPATEPTT
ncbi:MFS transporter [Actinomadura nitritigenes]|uniref:MFS transporter n=1 Tax=Actinomadura nitritigenes TaxID=134602 RepID=UPI003D8AEFCD